MERNPSLVSPSTPHLKSPLLSLNHTTPSCQPIPYLNTLMLLLCSTMKPSMISVEETWTSRDPLTPTWTDLSLKLSHPWPLPSDLMVPSTSISLNSKPIWCLTPESTLCFHHTLPSSQLRRPTTNNSLLLKSLTPPLNPQTWWPSVIPDMVSIWLVPCSTEVTSSPRMSMPQSQPSKPKELFNLLIGVPPVSRLESTINLPQLYPEVI